MEGYRYWSNAVVQELGIEGVEGEFLVNLEKRSIINLEGLKYEGKLYYTLSQLPNGLYNVDNGELPFLIFNMEVILANGKYVIV